MISGETAEKGSLRGDASLLRFVDTKIRIGTEATEDKGG